MFRFPGEIFHHFLERRDGKGDCECKAGEGNFLEMTRFAASATFWGIFLAVQATGHLPLCTGGGGGGGGRGGGGPGSASPSLLAVHRWDCEIFGDGSALRHVAIQQFPQPLLVLRGGGKGAKAGGSGGAGGSRNMGGGSRKKRPGRSGKEARKRRVRRTREHSREGGEQAEDGGGEGALDPAARATGAAAAGEGRRTMAENRIVKEMRAKGRHEAPPLMSKSTFSGLFDLSPPVNLPGHTGLTLEHFRGERRNVDDDGNELPKRTYTWRGHLVRVTAKANGANDALIDVETGNVLHRFAERCKVYLPGHEDVYLDDFPRERMATNTMGVYKWRDRVVRVLMKAGGTIDRIVDEEDGSIVFRFEEEDRQDKLLTAEMFDEEMFRYDRPGTMARVAYQADVMSGDGPSYGDVRVVWPQDTVEGRHHGGTIIWLHEMGSNAKESEEMVAKLDMPWIKFLLPTAPFQAVSVLNDSVTSSWFDVYELGNKWAKEDSDGLQRSSDYIASLVQDEVQRGISPEKIAIVGVGQGGCVALSAALRGYRYEETEVQVEGGEVAAIGAESAEEDEDDSRSKKSSGSEILRVAAVAGLSTWLPKSLVDLRPFWYGDMFPTYWAGKVVGKGGGLPMLLCHGKADSFVPFELGRRSYKRAQKVGFDAELIRYEDMGHGISRHELRDLEWFLSRKHLPDPVLRISQILGPVIKTGEAQRIQLEQAGWDPDIVDDHGYIKDYALETPRNDGYLMDGDGDARSGIVDVFGHEN